MKQMVGLRQMREDAHLKTQAKNGRLKLGEHKVHHSFLHRSGEVSVRLRRVVSLFCSVFDFL